MRRTVFDDRFSDLDFWTHRDLDYTRGRQFAKGHPSGASTTDLGLELRVLPDPNARDRYLYGHIGTQGQVSVQVGDHVHADIAFAPGRGGHGSLWLQGEQTYGTPADYEADIEHYGAKNPYRKTGVNLAQAVHWRAAGQDFGQYTSVKVDTSSKEFPPLNGKPWSDKVHHYEIRVHEAGFTFWCDGARLNRVHTASRPRPMFICLSFISRDFEYEDLQEAFTADPLGPGIMHVTRLWVTRPA